MSKNETTIEFYKRRTWSQSLMAGIDFYQQNMKIIYGNVFKVGLPFALIAAILVGVGINRWNFTDSSSSILHQIIYYSLILSGYSILFVVISYLLKFYQEGLINEPNKFKLMDDLAPYSAKIFVIFALAGVLLFLLGLALIDLISQERLYTVFVLVGIIIFLMPLLTFISYPVLFEDAEILVALSKGIKMGFKAWGPTFIMSFIISIIMTAIFYFFVLIGFIFTGIFSLLHGDLLLPISAFFGILDMCLVIPIPVICFAFYYFSIREMKEGVSLKAKIDDFENL